MLIIFYEGAYNILFILVRIACTITSVENIKYFFFELNVCVYSTCFLLN